jgi:hypothetical protein
MAPEHDEDKNLRELKAVLRGLQRIGDDRPLPGVAGKNLDRSGTARESLVNRRDRSRGGGAKEQASLRARADGKYAADGGPIQAKRLGALALAMIAAGTVIVLASDLFFKYWPTSLTSKHVATVNSGTSLPTAKSERVEAGISVSGSSLETRKPVRRLSTVDGQEALPTDTRAAPTDPAIADARQLMDGGHILTAREMLLQPALAESQEGAWLLARSFDPNYLATVQSPDATADKEQAEHWYRRWRDIGAQSGMVMDDLRLRRIIEAMR